MSADLTPDERADLAWRLLAAENSEATR